MSNSTRESLAAKLREIADSNSDLFDTERDDLRSAADALAAAAAPVAQGEPVAFVSPLQFAAHDPQRTGKPNYLPLVKRSEGLFTMPLYAAPASPAAGAEREATWRDGNRLDEHWLVDQAGLILAVVAPQSMGGGRPYLAHVGNSATLGPFVECQQARDAARAALDAPAQQPEPSPPSAFQAAQQADGAVEAWRAGRDAAADFLRKKRDDFCHEFGLVDPDTGALEFGRGARAEAQEQWVNDLEELADAIRAICPPDAPAEGPAAPVAQQAGGAAGDTLFRTFMAEAEKAGITHWPAPAAQQVAAEPAIDEDEMDDLLALIFQAARYERPSTDARPALVAYCKRLVAATQPAQPAGEPTPCELCQGAGKLEHRAGGEWPHSAHEFECPDCGGTGEVFAHADNCDDDLCALNGDVHSCVGKVEPCQCCATTPAREHVEALSEAEILSFAAHAADRVPASNYEGRVLHAVRMAESRLTQPKGRV